MPDAELNDTKNNFYWVHRWHRSPGRDGGAGDYDLSSLVWRLASWAASGRRQERSPGAALRLIVAVTQRAAGGEGPGTRQYLWSASIVGRYVRISTNIDQVLTKNTKNTKTFLFSKGHVTKKKNACGSGQRSKQRLGLPILSKYWQILINIILLSIIIN